MMDRTSNHRIDLRLDPSAIISAKGEAFGQPSFAEWTLQMPLQRTGYQLHFEEISPSNPSLGSVAIVPWDTEIFGFPVGIYRVGSDQLDDAARKQFVSYFQKWATQSKVCLCSTTIPVNESHSFWKHYLPEAGFEAEDLILQASLNSLQSTSLPNARSVLRLAQPNDRGTIEAMAAESFRNGRYHADPLFPRALADKRYRDWIRKALTAEDGGDRVYVMGEPGSITGFFHVTVEENISDLRLAAIAPELKGTLLGFDLYVSTLHCLKKLGVRRVVTSISATNTAVLNVYAMLGFSFSAPEMVFHWHGDALNESNQ